MKKIKIGVLLVLMIVALCGFTSFAMEDSSDTVISEVSVEIPIETNTTFSVNEQPFVIYSDGTFQLISKEQPLDNTRSRITLGNFITNVLGWGNSAYVNWSIVTSNPVLVSASNGTVDVRTTSAFNQNNSAYVYYHKTKIYQRANSPAVFLGDQYGPFTIPNTESSVRSTMTFTVVTTPNMNGETLTNSAVFYNPSN